MIAPKPDTALIIAAHGSTVNPDSSTPTWQHADRLRARGLFSEVQCCFWKEEPGFRDVFRAVDAREIYVVPNFISEGYFTQTIIPREMQLEGPVTRRGDRTIRYCDPVGSHPGMTRVLLARAEEVAPGIDKSKTALLITGHGTNLNDNSALAARQQAEAISAMNLYAEVHSTYMEEEPFISKWAEITTAPNVIVVPFFVADGLHSYQDIPVLLGIESAPTAAASSMEAFRNNPYRLNGRELYYASAIGTEPLFAEVILDQVEAFDAAHHG